MMVGDYPAAIDRTGRSLAVPPALRRCRDIDRPETLLQERE